MVLAIPFNIIVQYIPKTIDRRVLLILAMVLQSVALFFAGPSIALGLPDKLGFMILG